MRILNLLLCFFTPLALLAQTGPVSGALMNPSVSLIGDMRGVYLDTAARKFNFQFEEAELSLISSIDPYAKADVFISFARTPEGEYAAGLEEAYLTTLSLPVDLRARVGRFRLPVGRLNPVHPHALPFSDVPLASTAIFGDEGLIDDGISLSWLIPNPWNFYQEIELEASNVPLESPLFSRPDADRYLYLVHLKNFWDIDENSTLELGLSGMSGPNQDQKTSVLGAADLTLKWKPLQLNRYKSLTWQSEIFIARYGTEDGGNLRSFGFYSFLSYQVGERWFLTGKVDYSELPQYEGVLERGYSTTLGWYATEFQKIELGGRHFEGNIAADNTEFTLRWVFVIGAHGGHQY